MHDIRDGGERTLRLSAHPAGEVTVTDRRSGQAVPASAYEVGRQSVRKTRGEWASGSSRWLIEYEPAKDKADGGDGQA